MQMKIQNSNSDYVRTKRRERTAAWRAAHPERDMEIRANSYCTQVAKRADGDPERLEQMIKRIRARFAAMKAEV